MEFQNSSLWSCTAWRSFAVLLHQFRLSRREVSNSKRQISIALSKAITHRAKLLIFFSQIKHPQIIMVKSVLIYEAETWSLYEDDRRRVNATEMDALRRSARISKLGIKTNEYIREEMNAQDTILDEITRKQLIWYGHVERMDPT